MQDERCCIFTFSSCIIQLCFMSAINIRLKSKYVFSYKSRLKLKAATKRHTDFPLFVARHHPAQPLTGTQDWPPRRQGPCQEADRY